MFKIILVPLDGSRREGRQRLPARAHSLEPRPLSLLSALRMLQEAASRAASL